MFIFIFPFRLNNKSEEDADTTHITIFAMYIYEYKIVCILGYLYIVNVTIIMVHNMYENVYLKQTNVS